MSNGALDSLYKDRKITLWVEDRLRRDYLTAAWDDPPAIRLLVAGSNAPMQALVDHARMDGFVSVFGLRDRDFGPTNHPQWSTATRVFCLKMHEIENALLDPPAISAALATLGRTLSGESVREKLETEARAWVWGMALGSTLAWVKATIQQDFPSSAGLVNVADQASALARLVQSSWFRSHLPALPGQFTARTLEAKLVQEHAAYSNDLASDAFLSSFAGKELLGRVFSWVAQGRQAQAVTVGDLAKAIGNEQRLAQRLPGEVAELLAILLRAI